MSLEQLEKDVAELRQVVAGLQDYARWSPDCRHK